MARAARTATFCVSTVAVPAAMACIFSSTYWASLWTYASSRSPRIAYDCPNISTFTGALMEYRLAEDITSFPRGRGVLRRYKAASTVGARYIAPLPINWRGAALGDFFRG